MRICPICREPNLVGQQIICASCKADSPFTLLEGYSPTVKISDELNKIGSYKEEIDSLKKNRKVLLYVLSTISIAFVLTVIFCSVEINQNEFKKKEIQNETIVEDKSLIDSITIPLEANISQLRKELQTIQLTLEECETKISIPNSDTEMIHIVKEGESLYTIATKYFGDGMKYSVIAKDNNIKKTTTIYNGQKLVIRKP